MGLPWVVATGRARLDSDRGPPSSTADKEEPEGPEGHEELQRQNIKHRLMETAGSDLSAFPLSRGNCDCLLNHGSHGGHGNSEIQRHADDPVMKGSYRGLRGFSGQQQFNQLLLPFSMLSMPSMPSLFRL
jgi:hypothetical protein